MASEGVKKYLGGNSRSKWVALKRKILGDGNNQDHFKINKLSKATVFPYGG